MDEINLIYPFLPLSAGGKPIQSDECRLVPLLYVGCSGVAVG